MVMVMNLPLISCRTFLRLMGLGYLEHDNEDVTGCSLISYFHYRHFIDLSKGNYFFKIHRH